MALNNEQKSRILALYAQDLNVNQIAKKLEIHYNTVKNYLKREQVQPEHAKAFEKIQQHRESEYKDLLEIVSSTKLSNMVNTALDLLTPEALKKELEDNGIRPLITMIGTFIDKGLKYENIKLMNENNKLKTEVLRRSRVIVFEGEEDERTNNVV